MKCRDRHKVYKRCFLMAIMRSKSLTFTEIASMFCMNHASVVYQVNQYNWYMDTNDQVFINMIKEYSDFLDDVKVDYRKPSIVNDVLKCKRYQDLKKIKTKIKNGFYFEGVTM